MITLSTDHRLISHHFVQLTPNDRVAWETERALATPGKFEAGAYWFAETIKFLTVDCAALAVSMAKSECWSFIFNESLQVRLTQQAFLGGCWRTVVACNSNPGSRHVGVPVATGIRTREACDGRGRTIAPLSQDSLGLRATPGNPI